MCSKEFSVSQAAPCEDGALMIRPSFHNVFHRVWFRQFSLEDLSGKCYKSPKTGVLGAVTRKLTRREPTLPPQIARGPRNNRTGSIKSAVRRPRTPSTAIPTRRNGKRSNHTIGYSTSASRASGQHSRNRMIQRKKAAMATSLSAAATRSLSTGDRKAAKPQGLLRRREL